MREMQTSVAAILIVLAGIGLAACRGGIDEPPTATMTPTVTQNPTSTATEPPARPTPSIEEEVAEAYLAYWDAYAEAVLNLDIALVEGFVGGEELESIRAEIEMYEADGVAARIRVEHDFAVASASETTAVVIDEYVNNSFYVDAETKQPEEGEGTGEVIRDTIFMENIDGRWVVVRGTREQVD